MATTDTKSDTEFQHVAFERHDHVAVITLQRPDRLNALNRQMGLELHEALDQLAGEFPEGSLLEVDGQADGFVFTADSADDRCQAVASSLPSAE